MSDRIITGIYAQVSGQNQIFNYLLTDGAYHDPSLASQIVGGVARIAIASDATFDITESISFQPQGGSSGTSIGQIPIINDDGFFDNWARRTIAGMDWTVKRGYADQPWSEWVTIFAGKGRGRPEFSGQRIIVTLTDRFGYMREPVAQAVFDDATANQSLRNTTAPMVFGEAYQVRPALADPNILAYFSADNLAQVYSTSEGGNPATPQWVRLPQGVQLTASPSLVITTDIAGPPAEVPGADADVLDGQGQFEDWAAGELDYPDVTVQTTANATLAEGPNSSTGVLEVQASTSFDTGFVSGTNSIVSNSEIRSNNLGLSLPANAIVTGIEVTANARWQQTSGTTIATELITSMGIMLPNGLIFGDAPSPNELNETFAAYSVGGQFNLLGAAAGVLTAEDVNDENFRIRIKAYLFSGQQLVVSQFRVKIYYVEIEQYVRMTWADVLELGRRYTISVETVGDAGDAVLADWSASVDDEDPQSARSAAMAATNVHEYVFTAGMTDLDLFFYRGSGNGDQEINSIVVRQGSNAQSGYYDLIRYLHTTAGEDPDLVCDNDSLELVQAQADDPRLGWYVTDQTTREQLSTFLSHSLSAVTWGGIDGKWKAAQLRVPCQQPGQAFLSVVNSFSEPSAVPDYADDLRDRVHAAKNFYPIPEGEAAGITTNWTRNQREQILADWRITERADFGNLIDYEGGVLGITSIDPATGAEAGGTAVTIYGSGFAAGATVTVGGSAATSVVVVNSGEITCETPAGTAGNADVVVTVDGDSVTLVGGFEYQGSRVEFDNVSTGNTTTDTLTIPHDTTAEDDRYMVVSISFNSAATAADSVTYNGQALTQIFSDTQGNRSLGVWALVAPATGENDVVVNFPNSGEYGVTVRTFYNVHQSAPITDSANTKAGTGTSVSQSVTGSSTGLLIDCLALRTSDSNMASVLPDSGQTKDSAFNAGGLNAAVSASSHKDATGLADSMGWSWIGDDNHIYYVAALERA